GEKRGAAKQCVAGALEKCAFRKVLDHEAMGGKPGVEVRRFTGPHLVAKAGAEKAIVEDQAGIGSENQIGQTLLRRHQLDLDAEADERIMQAMPLLLGRLGRAAAGAAHPGIDLVLDAVVIRRAHQDAGMLSHTPSSFTSARRNGSASVTTPTVCTL